MEITLSELSSWWKNLDFYWKRYFSIQINRELEYDRKARETFFPSNEQLLELVNREYLDIYSTSIKDFIPLAIFTKLETLNVVMANEMISLIGIDAIRNLKYFNLQSSKVADISILATLPQLETISLQDGPITSIAVLKDLPKLNKLTISELPIADFDSLKNFHQLVSITISQLQIQDYSSLNNLRNLKEIELFKVNMSNFDFLNGLNALEKLVFKYSTIENPVHLPNLVSLKSIDLSFSNVSNIHFLDNCNNLENINWVETKIDTFNSLDKLTNLQEIAITESNFTIESILAFKRKHSNCKIVTENGIYFPFKKHELYQVTRDFSYKSGEFNVVKAGAILRFISYMYNHYDDIDIYTFEILDSKEVFAWHCYRQEIIDFKTLFQTIAME